MVRGFFFNYMDEQLALIRKIYGTVKDFGYRKFSAEIAIIQLNGAHVRNDE